jgi:FtsP/CotA-like multicopper oxidase with cupredoxin domain
LNRRTFIKHTAQAGIIAATSQRFGSLIAKSGEQNPLALNELRIPPVITGGDITIAPAIYKIFPDANSTILSINNSFPAPTIKLNKGDTFSAKIINNLSEPTVLHWHGIHVPANMDGHPKNAIAPGESFDVSYPITQRAGTFFYHSHADMNTARQSYLGMMGMFIIGDDEEKSLGLPSGDFDIPLLVQDKRFDVRQLSYAPTNPDMDSGWLGDTILINGTPNPFLSVAPTFYRFRIVNGSNARIYNIGLKGNDPQTVMTLTGNDGGLLEVPAQINGIMLAPAERIDVIVDLSREKMGNTVTLQSLAFDYSGSSGTTTLMQGAAFDLLQLQVNKTGSSGVTGVPTTLPTIVQYNSADVVNSRGFELTGHQFINSNTFNISRIDQHVPFGDLEKWTFINLSQEAHPMHTHGTQFQVINPSQPSEAGWKDVIRVDPSQSVNVLVKFADYTGIYLVHCHNLEHEDMGMMSNFQVEDSGAVKEENQEATQLKITPNPASDHAILKFPALEKDEMIIIADDKGDIILREILSQGSDIYGLATNNFSNGRYTLSIGLLKANLIVLR